MKEKKLKTNFLQISYGEFIGIFDRSFSLKENPSDFIEKIDLLMDKGRIIKSDNTTSVSRVEYNGKDIIIKRYNHKGIIHSIRHTIKKSRAHRGWRYANRLRQLNIATAKPLAYFEQRKLILVWKSYLVTEYVEGKKLYNFIRDRNVTDNQQLRATEQVIELLNKLGQHRITHGDLKHTNILITNNGPVLIDLDGMKIHKWNWIYRINRAKDLARFRRVDDISLMSNRLF